MNVGDYGDRAVFGTGFGGAGFDMSAFTTLTLTFTRPDNTTLVVSNPAVALGSGTYTLPSGQTYANHQYVTYTFQPGDVTVAGPWKVRLTYKVSPTISYTSGVAVFNVGS